jgi:hypothetical protein
MHLKLLPGSISSQLASLYARNRKRQRERRADVLLVSFAKSGRTWLRVMIGKAISDHFGLSGDVLDIDYVVRRRPSIPIIVETHDGGTVRARVSDVVHPKTKYRDKKVLFMVRDPRDIVVSAYFQASKRKRVFEGELSEFLRSPLGSIDTILAFYNTWARERTVSRAFHMVKYEDLHANPAFQLRGILDFIGLDEIQEASIQRAVEFASFENMRRLELEGEVGGGRLVLRPADKDDLESYKTRRGKTGGYRDYLSEQDIAYLDDRISKELDPCYEY